MRESLLVLLATATLGLVAIGCSDGPKRDDSGQIVGEGELGVFDFKVGDCFQDPEVVSTGGVADVPAVPCSTPHDNEVYYLHDVSGQFSQYPGDGPMDDAASEACLGQFEGYVGKDYQSSRLNYTWLAPTAQTWEEADDREVVCALYDNDGLQLTGSMKGSGE